ncbi:hypothetical protein AAGS61_10370 [Lysinibacillus sp. KU-BSD001]|uniref:hypothetical protein n=1 Tax=Lysinibacillus sp. KU-BSD001 TaxID=3141328 RepID=UPI0036E89C4B
MYNNPFDDFDSPNQRFFPQGPGGWPAPPPGGPPPFGGPSGGGGGGRPPQPGGPTPMAPPPNFTPPMPSTYGAQAMHGGGWDIRICLYRNTYVWLRNGRSFWFYPVAVTRNLIIGFRWSTRSGWTYRTINRDNLLTFTCFFG